MRARAFFRPDTPSLLWVMLAAVLGMTGCAPLHEKQLATWEVRVPAADGYLRVALASGQIIVTGSDEPLDVAGGLAAENFPQYLHAGIIVEDPDGWHVYEGNASTVPWGAGPPTAAMIGRIGRVPIDTFVRRHPYVVIFEPRDVDLSAVVAFARIHRERATPFDPHFDNDDRARFYCTQFVALALEAGGMEPIPYTPRRENPSMRVIFDWLRIRGPGTIQADSVIRGARLVARLSVEQSAAEIMIMTAAKRELHRRFTCDQRAGNVFRRTLDGIDFRVGVQHFLDRAVALLREGSVAPEPAAIAIAVQHLANELFGPMLDDGTRPTCA